MIEVSWQNGHRIEKKSGADEKSSCVYQNRLRQGDCGSRSRQNLQPQKRKADPLFITDFKIKPDKTERMRRKRKERIKKGPL